MKKEDFIKWIDESIFEKVCDNWYRYLMNYSEFIYDEVEIDEFYVTYCWDEMYWGGSTREYRKLEFEEFIECYNNGNLRW